MTIYIYFSGKIDLNQRILQEGRRGWFAGGHAMPYALCAVRLLNTDRQFDEEGRSFWFVVPYPDIAVVIGNDGINNGQP